MTHYDEFNLSPDASAEEIRLAHRNLARLLHPDTLQDPHVQRLAESQMKRINRIYAILSDPAQRRAYDLQIAGAVGFHKPAGPKRVDSWRVAIPWLIAAAGVSFGLYPRPVEPARPVRQESASAVAPTSVVGQAPQSEPETPRLKRRGRELEREQRAPAAVTPATPQPAVAPRQRDLETRSGGELAPEFPVLKATPGPAALPAPSREIDVTAPSAPAPPPSAASSPLTGTWLYVQGTRRSAEDLYPPEYIELTLTGEGGSLWGRYRARYHVADRAISPDVNFSFELSLPVPERIAWSGNGGAKGELRLKLLSENRLSVDWFTKSFGHQLALGSGTAILVRRDSER